MKKTVYIFVLLISLTGAVQAKDQTPVDTVKSAPGITIESSLDRAEIYIGDLINYTLTIIHDSDIILTPPPIGANLGAFDVKDYKADDEIRLPDGRIKTESRFLLTTFTTGDYLIPPIPVEYMLPDSTEKILISEPVPIKVKSLLADAADTADIRDIKGPIEFKSKIPLWLYFAAGVAVLAVIVLLIWWWIVRRRRKPEEPVDLRDPWEIAFEELALLQGKNYPVAGEFKQFYIELTEIVRAYLQRIYRMPVLDMTTYEFLTAIVQEDIEEDLYNRLKAFLDFGDLVKFAKLIPELEKAESDYEEACDLVAYIRSVEMSKVSMPAETAAESAGDANV